VNILKKTIIILSLIIVLFSAIATVNGIYNKSGDGSYLYQTIRGETVEIYGQGLYKHMSAEVAIQGIAQDYITLYLAIPLLILSLIMFMLKTLPDFPYFWEELSSTSLLHISYI